MAHGTSLAPGDLTAIIGDNSAHEGHRAGYNGVWSLTHRTEPINLFVPAVAGLNFEHIFDGEHFDRDNSRTIFFEPRNAPMTFRKISDTDAELHQPPTPTFHLESWTRFTLVAPHYVDMSFRFRPTQHAFRNRYVGLFWASYINGPDDKSMYFRNARTWHQLCTQRHNDESTLRSTPPTQWICGVIAIIQNACSAIIRRCVMRSRFIMGSIAITSPFLCLEPQRRGFASRTPHRAAAS